MDKAGGEKKLHDDLNLVGFRALATAAAVLQLTRELLAAGLLKQDALGRIKEAMIGELLVNLPRSPAARAVYEKQLHERLNALFSGTESLSENVVTPPDAA
jgi:hypothetical protein